MRKTYQAGYLHAMKEAERVDILRLRYIGKLLDENIKLRKKLKRKRRK